MVRSKGAFGSRSVAFRPKKPHSHSKASASTSSRWKPKGPFRFPDLPPELRNQILQFAILDWDSHKDVLSLFLTSRTVYSEAAAIFYREVELDNMQLRGSADPFLKGPSTALSPRLHVRNLIIRFCMKDQLHLFSDSYARAIAAMVEEGNLQYLRLEIGSRFPADDFWGLSYPDRFCDDVRLLGGKRRDTDIHAPAFVTRPPFQSFLRFLKDSGVPKLKLYVDADDHHKFWCQFHRARVGGRECGGEWEGKAKALKIDRRALIRALKGAQVTNTW